MSVNADSLFDDYWFVLAPPGRARGLGGSADRPAAPAMRKSLLNAVGRKPQVMIKITSFAKSREGLAAHLDYISRNGENAVFDPTGERFSAIGDQMNLAARDALQHYGRELAIGPIGEGASGKRKGRSRSRVSMNFRSPDLREYPLSPVSKFLAKPISFTAADNTVASDLLRTSLSNNRPWLMLLSRIDCRSGLARDWNAERAMIASKLAPTIAPAEALALP